MKVKDLRGILNDPRVGQDEEVYFDGASFEGVLGFEIEKHRLVLTAKAHRNPHIDTIEKLFAIFNELTEALCKLRNIIEEYDPADFKERLRRYKIDK